MVALAAVAAGDAVMTELCADVPETVAGCDDCLQLWDEMMVTEAQVKVTCACVNGTETLEPWQACQADEESWEAEFAGHERDCAAEAASFGYTACLD